MIVLTAVCIVVNVVICVAFYVVWSAEHKRRIALQAQLTACPPPDMQTWIDRYNQSVTDCRSYAAAAERLLLERNKLQNALDRIEYAATTAQPVSDDELMKALESERPRLLDWRCKGCNALWSAGSEWRWNTRDGSYEHLHGNVLYQAERIDGTEGTPVEEFRGGCMGHA